MNMTRKPIAVALGAAFALSGMAAQASVFQTADLGAGYMLASAGDDKSAEGKCGEAKCGEAKCGEKKAETTSTDKSTEASCGEKKAEAKCGEGKCGEKTGQ